MLKRLDNIDVLCADVATMERFYREVLELPHVLPYDPDQGWAGFQAGDVTIFLIGSSETPGPRAIPGAGPPGFESFAFQVDDLDQAIAEFERRGSPGQPRWSSRPGTGIAASMTRRETSST